MTQKVLVVDADKCTGCRLCVYACSFEKEKVFSPSKSRIQLVRLDEVAISIPILCEQCEKPLCIEVCPVNAIVKDPETGIVTINENLCIGCKECLWVCPFGAVTIDPDKRIAVKCDLCGGDPKCAQFCTQKAIMYVRADRVAMAKKWDAAERRVKVLKAIA